MKAAILGSEDYHATMRQVADTSLRRILSYIPPQMNPDSIQIPIPPVHVDYLERVDPMMQELSRDCNFIHCNKRSLYLVLAWLLIGSDNEHRIYQYVDDGSIPKQMAIVLIRIALGDIPSFSERKAIVRKALTIKRARFDNEDAWVAWAAIRTVAEAAGRDSTAWTTGATGAVINAAIISVTTKARQWAHISDEQALQIAHRLTLDILSL